jgi:hypothetical protein
MIPSREKLFPYFSTNFLLSNFLVIPGVTPAPLNLGIAKSSGSRLYLLTGLRERIGWEGKEFRRTKN